MIAAAVLLLLLSATLAQAVEFTLAWTAPPSAGVLGYRVHVGSAPRTYTQFTDVGNVTQAALGGFEPDTLYYFTVSALYDAGESDYANEVSLSKPPSDLDTEPPVVQITSPANGSTVTPKSQVTITAEATDNLGVVATEITVNGKVLCTRNQAPYSCPWKVPAAKKRVYVLEALSRDAGSNVGTSPPVTVKSQ